MFTLIRETELPIDDLALLLAASAAALLGLKDRLVRRRGSVGGAGTPADPVGEMPASPPR